MEIERHEVTHIPPMPWCLVCRLGKGLDASHFRSPPMREAAQIQVDFCFLREDAAAYDVATDPVPENPWAMILCAVDVATQNPLVIALPGKNAELEYRIGAVHQFHLKARVHGMGHQERWRTCHLLLTPLRRTSQTFVFVFLSPPRLPFSFFFSSLWGSSRGILVLFFESRNPRMHTFGLSGSKRSRRFKHQNSTRRPPQEEERTSTNGAHGCAQLWGCKGLLNERSESRECLRSNLQPNTHTHPLAHQEGQLPEMPRQMPDQISTSTEKRKLWWLR